MVSEGKVMSVASFLRRQKNVSVGSGTAFAAMPKILWHKYGTKLTIGGYCSIAAGTTFIMGGHHFFDSVCTRHHYDRRKRRGWSKGDLTIGSDVWIGHDATILDGLTIGHGVVIGAKAVVASSVEPYSIVVGNPARVIHLRFDPWIVGKLLFIAWWDWPPKLVLERRKELESDDVVGFVNRYDKAC
jgi:acetyltransferase-like isoleucine patch superfamily enzyme